MRSRLRRNRDEGTRHNRCSRNHHKLGDAVNCPMEEYYRKIRTVTVDTGRETGNRPLGRSRDALNDDHVRTHRCWQPEFNSGSTPIICLFVVKITYISLAMNRSRPRNNYALSGYPQVLQLKLFARVMALAPKSRAWTGLVRIYGLTLWI